MMDLQTIVELNRRATNQAKRHGKRPAVPTAEQRAVLATGELAAPGWSIPSLGDYVPKGWELVETHFVDKSGFGAPGEPALTQGAFAKVIASAPEGDGWASTEEGQFQIYVNQYRPE